MGTYVLGTLAHKPTPTLEVDGQSHLHLGELKQNFQFPVNPLPKGSSKALACHIEWLEEEKCQSVQANTDPIHLKKLSSSHDKNFPFFDFWKKNLKLFSCFDHAIRQGV